jgi:hypothetical protein
VFGRQLNAVCMTLRESRRDVSNGSFDDGQGLLLVSLEPRWR